MRCEGKIVLVTGAQRGIGRSVALRFMTYKIIQLIAVAYYGFLTVDLVLISVGFTLVGLAAFSLGLKVQDRLPEKTFNRAVQSMTNSDSSPV